MFNGQQYIEIYWCPLKSVPYVRQNTDGGKTPGQSGTRCKSPERAPEGIMSLDTSLLISLPPFQGLVSCDVIIGGLRPRL